MATEAVDNPFVGPRPYSSADAQRFWGRGREIDDLAALVIANRCVLLHSRSGAGKTSLINAGLMPRLAVERLVNVLVARPALRSLESLAAEGAGNGDEVQVLVIDQLEELFTSRAESAVTAAGFVASLCDLLERRPMLRLVMSMREEWLADVDAFAGLFPGNLRTRYRLEPLDGVAAMEAIEEPFRVAGKQFERGVLEALVADLSDENGVVEPVQLQVVCFELYRAVPPDVSVIDDAMRRRSAVVGEALKAFYESSLTDSRKTTCASIPSLRRWFDEELITADLTRGLSRRGDHHTGGVSNRAIDFLESRHIIRPEARGTDVWYELSHDRLIEPIRNANSSWRLGRRIRKYAWMAAGVGAVAGLVILGLALVLDDTQDQATTARDQAVAKSLTMDVLSRVRGSRDDSLALVMLKAAASFNSSEPLLGLAMGRTLEQPYLVHVLPSPLQRVTAIMWSPDGGRVAAAGTGGGAQVWELSSGKVVPQPDAPFTEAGAIAWSSDGTQLAVGDLSGTVTLWTIASGETATMSTGSDGITALAWHPSQRTVVAGTRTGNVRVIDLTTRVTRLLARLPPLSGLPSRVSSVAFSQEGQLAVASWDRRVRVWRSLDRPPVSSPRMLSPVSAVAWSKSGRLASAGWDNTVRVWDANTMRESDRREGSQRFYAVAWSYDERSLLAAGADQQIHVWPWGVAAPEQALSGTGGVVNGLAVDPTSDRFAHITADGAVRVWSSNAIGPEEYRGLDSAVTAARMTASGELIAGAADGTVRVWFTVAGQRREATLVGPIEPASHIAAMFEDGVARVFAAGSFVTDPSRGTVCVWNLTQRTTWAGSIRRAREGCHTTSVPVSALAYRASDGTLFVGDEGGNVSILKVKVTERGRLELERESQPVKTAEARITQLLLQASEVLAADAGGRVTQVGASPATSRGEPQACPSLPVYAWNDDGSRRAVACGRDVSLRANSEDPSDRSFSVPSDVTRLSWSPDGSLVYGLEDGTVGLYCAGVTASELCVAIPAHAGRVSELTWSADGGRLLTGGADNILRLWRPPQPFRLDPCNVTTRDLSEAEWQQFVGANIPYAPPCRRP